MRDLGGPLKPAFGLSGDGLPSVSEFVSFHVARLQTGEARRNVKRIQMTYSRWVKHNPETGSADGLPLEGVTQMQKQNAFLGILATIMISSLTCATEHSAARVNDTGHKASAGALEGIYVGFGLEHSHMGSHQYYFSADGWVINNIPRVNMDDFDITAYRNDPSNKLFVGRYRVDGNRIHIVWANNADRRDVIKYNESASEPGIDTYIPTCSCTGKRFSGKYHWSSPTDQRYIQLFPDGTFFDYGLTDQVVGVPNPHGYAGITDPPRKFRGTYSIKNQRLTFNFADGKHATVAFIAPKVQERAAAFDWFGLGHGTGVPGAETVVLLMMYEEHYQVQP